MGAYIGPLRKNKLVVTVWILQRCNANQIAFLKKKIQEAKRAKVFQCKITPVTTVMSEKTHKYVSLDLSLTLLSNVHVGAHCFIYTSAFHWKLAHLTA